MATHDTHVIKSGICYLTAFALMAPNTSFAVFGNDDLTLIPSLAYQQKQLNFDQQYRGVDNNQADFSVQLPMLSVSLTGAYKKLFATVKYESNLSEIPTSTDETDRVKESSQFNLIATDHSQVNVSREDFSMTAGYTLWRSLNIFGGFLFGETQLKPQAFCDKEQTSANVCDSGNRAYQQLFLETHIDPGSTPPTTFLSDQPEYRQNYQEKGFFLGLSYTLPVAEIGSLSFSTAYANMDGEYWDNASDPNNNWGGGFQRFNFSGKTTGTSVGTTWSGSLGDDTGYFIDARWQSYAMKGEDPNFPGITLNTKETMVGITTGIKVYF